MRSITDTDLKIENISCRVKRALTSRALPGDLVPHRPLTTPREKKRPRPRIITNELGPARKEDTPISGCRPVGGTLRPLSVPNSPHSGRCGSRLVTLDSLVDVPKLSVTRTPRTHVTLSRDTKDVAVDADFGELSRHSKEKCFPQAKESMPAIGTAVRRVNCCVPGKVVQKTKTVGDNVCASLSSKCIECRASFGDNSEAKFCLTCGAPRMENQVFEELFDMLLTSRATMRKADLCRFHLKMEDLMQKETHGKKRSAKRNLTDIQFAYCETLAQQTLSGCKQTQGITKLFFQDFVLRVAESFELNCRSLLTGLIGQEKSHLKGADDPNVNLEMGKTWCLSSTQTACAKCGSPLLMDANYCPNCGQQFQRAPSDFHNGHFFKGTWEAMLGLRTKEQAVRERDFAELLRLSQGHHMAMDVVESHWNDFQSLCLSEDHLLPKEQFEKVVRERCNIPDDSQIPEDILSDKWFKETNHHDKCVDFEAFLLWSLGTEYIEERVVPDPQERYLRRLARKYSMKPFEVDNLKEVFDQFDLGGNGVLDESSFMQTVLHLMHSKNVMDLSHPILKRCWREVSYEGDVTFDTFLAWYLTTSFRARGSDHV